MFSLHGARVARVLRVENWLEVSKRQYLSKTKTSNVHDFVVAKNTVCELIRERCVRQWSTLPPPPP
jgi:hypothetical protein